MVNKKGKILIFQDKSRVLNSIWVDTIKEKMRGTESFRFYIISKGLRFLKSIEKEVGLVIIDFCDPDKTLKLMRKLEEVGYMNPILSNF